MIRTHILPCTLPNATCDTLNLHSGRLYSGIVSRHWRLWRQKSLWLSEKALTTLSDLRVASRDIPLHAHSIDAAQQGFFNACRTTRVLRKAGFPAANFPWRQKKFRTTVWKNTALKRKGATLELSTGARYSKVLIPLPPLLHTVLKVIEVRLVFHKKSRRYSWHIVAENGKAPKPAPGTNIVSVDPGEIHPAVIGDEHSATVITCRERRARQRGHAKHLQAFSVALARKKKGSRQYKKLIRARTRCKATYALVMRDMAHKISHAVVEEAVERNAHTMVYGDIRDIADGIDKGAVHNQRMSQWNHGKARTFVEYKAQAAGLSVVLQNEKNTTKTCPQCGHRHKPRGRNYLCPACRFQAPRDVVGQVNILSAYLHGMPGKMAAPATVKYRIPHSVRVLRKCQGTGQPQGCSLENAG